MTQILNGILNMTAEELMDQFSFDEKVQFIECNLLTSRISYPDYM